MTQKQNTAPKVTESIRNFYWAFYASVLLIPVYLFVWYFGYTDDGGYSPVFPAIIIILCISATTAIILCKRIDKAQPAAGTLGRKYRLAKYISWLLVIVSYILLFMLIINPPPRPSVMIDGCSFTGDLKCSAWSVHFAQQTLNLSMTNMGKAPIEITGITISGANRTPYARCEWVAPQQMPIVIPAKETGQLDFRHCTIDGTKAPRKKQKVELVIRISHRVPETGATEITQGYVTYSYN